MEARMLIEKLAAQVPDVPKHADVIMLRQHSVDEIVRRAKRFLSAVGDASRHAMEYGDWVSQPNRTLIRMPLGARAVLYHASGAMELRSGLSPMEALFKEAPDKDSLVKLIEEITSRARISEWLGSNTSLEFERLWYIKAAAAGREGKPLKPVLCRAVGAYRQRVAGLPVWGPASVAVKVAAEGELDSLTLQARETTEKVIERAEILRPEQAARQITSQLYGLMGKSKLNLNEAAKPEWMRFGYFSLPKRKPQRVLAPAYIAAITVKGQESQAYLFTVPATETAYVPLFLAGSEAPPSRFRRASGETVSEMPSAAAD